MNDDTVETQVEEPQWGRRESDHDGGRSSTAKVDQADKVIRIALVVLLVMFAALALGALGIGWNTGQRMEQLINETQLSAQRNTELLAVECNLETGKPYPLPSEEPFVNTDEFLIAFCGRQVRQANVISGHLATINTQAKEQLTVHEENMLKEHQRIEALIQRQRAAPVVKKPIPTTKKSAPATSTTTTIGTTVRPTPPAPTTTTCVPDKRERCKEKKP